MKTMTLLTRIKTETILLESDIKELIDILISPSIELILNMNYLVPIRARNPTTRINIYCT